MLQGAEFLGTQRSFFFLAAESRLRRRLRLAGRRLGLPDLLLELLDGRVTRLNLLLELLDLLLLRSNRVFKFLEFGALRKRAPRHQQEQG